MRLWRALLPLLVYACRAALGQSVVTAVVGDQSVSLPGETKPLGTVPSVLWTRGSEEVLLRVSQGDDARKQSPLFRGRVQMKPDALQSRDVTLVLNKPALSDSGTYTCVTREGSTELTRFSVELKVKESESESVPIVPVVVGTLSGVVALVATIVSALTLKRTKKTNESFKDALLGLVACRKPASVL